ncbi:MAG: GDSL-type esterase/lipase family protein, partial [Verrucomicrobiales bacterium]
AKAAAELERIQAAALEEILEGVTELTPAQLANFEKWLPHTFKRLQRRLPVHIVVLGDSVTRYMSYDENRENSHYAYHGIFAARLADEFFYTGGVRDIQPTMDNKAKLEPLLGPELTLENLGMNGRLSMHALSRITTDGLVNRPDLVLINFGINDAMISIRIPDYLEAIETAARYIRSTGADVILLGPSHMVREKTIGEISLTRAYSAALRELSERLGVFFFDLGSVTMAVGGTPAGLPPAQALSSIAEAYEATHFDHPTNESDGLHPNPSTHRAIGAAMFKSLRDGPPAEPYRLGGYFSLESDGAAILEFKLKNLQEVPVKGQLLLMPAGGMVPDSGPQVFDLAAGKAKVFRVRYRVRSGNGFDLPSDAPRVFVPMILTDAERTYSPVISAPVTPLGVMWDTGSVDLAGDEIEVKCRIAASSITQEKIAGSYEASWSGQSSNGEFSVAPGAPQVLVLKFKVPEAAGKFSVRDQLVLTLKAGGKSLRFVRRMEASRNLGLGEPVDMVNPGRYISGEESPAGKVQFMAQATSKELVLNFDVDGIKLEGGGKVTPLILEFQLDARGYGKRRKFGYVDIVRVRFGLDGVAERMSELRPAVFGDWYNRALDKEALTAVSSPQPDGRMRYSVRIPRSYLYLHEYALGNGNSLLGINAELFFAKDGDELAPYPEDRCFTLVESGFSPYAAEGLTVLELVETSTGRWSVRLN